MHKVWAECLSRWRWLFEFTGEVTKPCDRNVGTRRSALAQLWLIGLHGMLDNQVRGNTGSDFNLINRADRFKYTPSVTT